MLECIRASRFLIGLLLALLAWAELAGGQGDDDFLPALAPDPARSTYVTSNRGGSRPPSGQAPGGDLLVARSQMLPPTPTAAVLPSLPPPPPPSSPPAPESRDLGLFKVTAYSDSIRNGTDGRGITRSGEKTRWGVVAVDPSVIPLGSKLSIEGMEDTLFMALDTGGGVVGRWLDIWFHTDHEALQHGVKERRVRLMLN